MKYSLLFLILCVCTLLSTANADDIFGTGYVSIRSLECDACEWAIRYTEHFISNNSTDMIESLVKESCNLMPTRFLIACDHFAEYYIHQIRNSIISIKHPEAICYEFDFCRY